MRVSLVKVANYPLFAGLALSFTGLLGAPLYPGFHPEAMLAGAAFAFPTAMFLLFTSGYKRGGEREGLEGFLAILSMALATAGLLVSLLEWRFFAPTALASLTALLVFSVKQLEGRVRWPHVLLLTLPPAMGAGLSLLAWAGEWGVLKTGLGFGLYYAAPMITCVSLLTSSRNYGSSWHPFWVLLPLTPSALGLALFSLDNPLFTLASSLHLLTHFASIRLWGARGFWRRLKASKNPFYRKGGTALIASHFSALLGALVFTLISIELLSPGVHGTVIALIHAAYLGFIAPHIHYHAVTMLPQITPLKPTRVFLLPALFLWPLATVARLYEPQLGLALVLAAIIGLLAEFKPPTITAWLRFLASTCDMPHACRSPRRSPSSQAPGEPG